MADEPVRPWGKVREDFRTHPRTSWFSAIEQSLFLQCRCANQIGVLERSLAGMAREASGNRGLITVTPELIEKAIGLLVAGRHCVWYREIETLWWVNMADEQQPKPGDGRAQYWAQLGTQVVPKLGTQVREGLLRRYPQLDPKKSGDYEDVKPVDFADIAQVGLFVSDTDTEPDPEPEGEGARKPGPSSPRRGGRSGRVHGSFIDSVIDCFNEHRSAVLPNTRGVRRDSKTARDWVRKATRREGATLEDWRLRITHLCEAARRDPFWQAHITTLEYLHRRGAWEKWEHESAIPPHRVASRRSEAKHSPSDFDRADRSFGGGR